MILLALALTTAQPVTVQLSEDQARAVMCRGPVARIPDDDPGLALPEEREAIADRGLEAAKTELAFWRGETCGDAERGEWAASPDLYGGLSRAEMEKALDTTLGLVCPNGVNDFDGENRPSCD